MKSSEKFGELLLWPGNKVCDLLRVTGDDHRLILRLFMNLLFYGALGLIVMILIID